MTEKVTGYLLIVLGLAMMAFALFSVYNVFTNKGEIVNLFNLPGISIDLSSALPADMPKTEESQTTGLKTDLIPSETINKPLNLIAHLLFMSFVLNVGFKIASIGVQLVRTIKVNLREEKKSVLEP